MSEKPASPRADSSAVVPDHVLIVRAGHGANCSSIGSVIDTLFVTALAGGAIFAAVAAALGQEPVRVVKPPPESESQRAQGNEESL
jgi:hypothetical protein